MLFLSLPLFNLLYLIHALLLYSLALKQTTYTFSCYRFNEFTIEPMLVNPSFPLKVSIWHLP